ncbi:putative triacylglycerol lipase [Helianthus annuus]|nr:putative triacylglycerol lipase [Helianthus annuus]
MIPTVDQQLQSGLTKHKSIFTSLSDNYKTLISPFNLSPPLMDSNRMAAGLVLLVAFTVAAAAAGGGDGDGTLGASYIFGDSLVDAGNNNFLPTLSKANIKPNGIDFKPSGGNPTGRYTNGRTIGDIIGMSLYHIWF